MNVYCSHCGFRLLGPVCGRCGAPSVPNGEPGSNARRGRRVALALAAAALLVAGAAAGVGVIALNQSDSPQSQGDGAAAAPTNGVANRAKAAPADSVTGGQQIAPETRTVTVPAPAPAPSVPTVGSDAQARADRCVSSLTVILQDVVSGTSTLAQGESQIPHQAARDLLDEAVYGVQSVVAEGGDQAGAIQDASYAEFHHYCQNKYGLPD